MDNEQENLPEGQQEKSPEEGEVRDTGWRYSCQNCGSIAYEQESFSEGRWYDAGVQCRTCWRTYYSANDYTY